MKPPVISIVIPVYREADRIGRLLAHLRRQTAGQPCQIVVVDGDPAGSTLRVIADPGVDTVIAPKGRARQMNAGAERATSEVLLFLHADTLLPDNAVGRIVNALRDPRVVAGAFDFVIDTPSRMLRSVARVASARARLTRLPLGDQGIFIRRDYFQRIGGYKDIPVMEDLDLMRRVKAAGGGVRVLGERVTTSARRMEREGVWYCTVRNLALFGLFWMGVPPERLKPFYPDGPDRREL